MIIYGSGSEFLGYERREREGSIQREDYSREFRNDGQGKQRGFFLSTLGYAILATIWD